MSVTVLPSVQEILSRVAAISLSHINDNSKYVHRGIEIRGVTILPQTTDEVKFVKTPPDMAPRDQAMNATSAWLEGI